MKKIFFSLFIFILFLTVPIAYADNIVNYDADGICEAVKTNKTIRIGTYGYYDKKHYNMESPQSTCNNSGIYEKKKEDIKKGESFVKFGRMTSTNKMYIDNVLVRAEKVNNKFNYFYVSNRNKTSTPNNLKTLKPGEKSYIYINLSDKKLKSDSQKDLRLSLEVGIMANTDIEIPGYNTIGIFVYTDKKTYGPYSIVDYKLQNVLTERNKELKNYKIDVYKMVSSNLVASTPSGETIKGIRIYPYYNYTINKGSFRLFNISLDGYSKYDNGKKYITVENAESLIRHNVVDNMLENATVKWGVKKGTTKLYFYHHYSKEPWIMNSNDSKITSNNYYGIPYVNQVNTTIDQFTHQGEVADKTKAKKNNTPYFLYVLPTKYKYDTTTNHGKKIKAGDSIAKNTLYIYESNESLNNNMKITRGKDLADTTKQFISNVKGYYLGLDCSSSTYLAEGREISTYSSLAASNKYYSNYQVFMLNGIKISADKVEKYIRQKGLLKENEFMTVDLYKKYYVQYIKSTYSMDTIYDNYASLVPGDILDKQGHVRMVSGYPHVVCVEKNAKGNQIYSNKYKKGSCKEIDPDKSYIITTEVGGYHTGVYTRSREHIAASKTGWTYTLNSNITDLKSIDDLYDPNKKLLSTYNINNKYTFRELSKSNSEIYMGFRYREITNHVSKNEIEIPKVNFVLDKEYSDKNKVVYNYLSKTNKLKGRIFTNYLIDIVRVEINGTKYYIYPYQTNNFSLYEITDTAILNKLKSLDYSKQNKIKVSVKFGPDIDEVRKKAGADSQGFIKFLDINSSGTQQPVLTTGIKLNKTSATINVGKTTTLTATVTPTNATDKTVIWSSNNTKIATVTDGKVKGISNGTVTITAKTKDTGKTATAKITVTTPVTGIELSIKETTINIGETEKITATILPENASNKGVTWKSNDTSIATVDQEGNIKGIKEGKTTITATTKDGGKTATVEVTIITPTIRVTGVTLNINKLSLTIDSIGKLTATVKPSNATNKAVTFSSADPTIATVDGNGVVTAKGVGTTTITVTTNDGDKTATATVEVKPIKVEGISLNKKELSLEIGETETLKATITPTNATNKKVIWSSASTKVATIDQNGKIVAKSEGMTTITVATEDGNKTATAKVYVHKTEPIDEGGEDEETEDPPVDIVEPAKPTNPAKPTTPTAPEDPKEKEDPMDPEEYKESEDDFINQEKEEPENANEPDEEEEVEKEEKIDFIKPFVLAFGSTLLLGGGYIFITKIFK